VSDYAVSLTRVIDNYISDILHSHGLLQHLNQSFDPATKLRAHFATIRSIFGTELPGPEFVQHTPGIADGQLTFTVHSNGDVAAHLWLGETRQWMQLGFFSYSRKRIDGLLSTERLRGQKIGSPIPPDTLDYFRDAAKQHERNQVPPPEVLTFKDNGIEVKPPVLPTCSDSMATQTRKELLDRLAMPPPSIPLAHNSVPQFSDNVSEAYRQPTQMTLVMPDFQSRSSKLLRTSTPERRSIMSSLRDMPSQTLSYEGLELPRDISGQPLVQYGVKEMSVQLNQHSGLHKASESGESATMDPYMACCAPLFDIQERTCQSPMLRSEYEHYDLAEKVTTVNPRLLVPWGVNDSLAAIRSSDGLDVARSSQDELLQSTLGMEAMNIREQISIHTTTARGLQNPALYLLGVQVRNRERGRTVLHDPFKGSGRKDVLVGFREPPAPIQHRRDSKVGFDCTSPSTSHLSRQASLYGPALSKNYNPPHWNNQWFEESGTGAKTTDMKKWWANRSLIKNREHLLQSVRGYPNYNSADQVLLPVCENLLSYIENTPLNRIKLLVPWKDAPRNVVDLSPQGRSSFFTNHSQSSLEQTTTSSLQVGTRRSHDFDYGAKWMMKPRTEG
jgi:hypothetical protein